uniref:Uncharacterized protein n=1 Tax=Avena sativa TaxID=4498 RepID=A0ACD5VIW6_AVESA
MEQVVWFVWAATVAFALVYYQLLTRRHRGKGRSPPCPGPRPLPLLGNMLDLRGDLHHTLARLAGTHGPVMMLKLGLTTTVVVSSRDAAKEAYTKHDRHLAARAVPDAATAAGYAKRSMVWLPSSDPLWKTLRGTVASNVFSPRGLAAARGVHERKVRDIVAYFRRRAGQEVDVGQALYGGALNLVSSAFVSVDLVDVGARGHGLKEIVEDLVAAIAKPNVSDLFPFLRPLDLQGWRRWARGHYDKVFGVLGSIVDVRLAADAKARTKTDTAGKHQAAGDFLDSLLELVSAGKISRDIVVAILFDVFTAGSEAIAVTVVWAIAELIQNPRMMAKVRAEMQQVLGRRHDAAIGELDAANLLYLQAVVKEAMRLHPVAPIMLPHQAVAEGVELGGYAVPKGSTVIFNVWAIMRDPRVWERPDEFVPERFMDMADKVEFHGKDFQFIPFGSGRRICPGLPMAERVVPFILASLLHTFEWRLPDGVSADEFQVTEKFSYVNTLAIPLKAVPVVIV